MRRPQRLARAAVCALDAAIAFLSSSATCASAPMASLAARLAVCSPACHSTPRTLSSRSRQFQRMTAQAAASGAAAAVPAVGSAPPPPPLPAGAPPGDFAALIPGLMHWVRFCNNGAAAAAAGEFLDLSVGGKTVGYLKPRWGGREVGRLAGWLTPGWQAPFLAGLTAPVPRLRHSLQLCAAPAAVPCRVPARGRRRRRGGAPRPGQPGAAHGGHRRRAAAAAAGGGFCLQ